MLAGGDQHPLGRVLLQRLIAPVVVGAEGLLDPLQTQLVGLVSQAGGVVQIQRHPAVEHQPEVVAAGVAHGLKLGQVLA
ncbi:hypothetical protein D3C77_723460 [compost metagenome]